VSAITQLNAVWYITPRLKEQVAKQGVFTVKLDQILGLLILFAETVD